MNVLNPHTISQAQVVNQQFINYKPFKHVVIENFFTQEFCQKPLDDFPDFDKKLRTNGNVDVGGKAVHEHVSKISEAYKQLDELVKSNEFLKLVESFTGIQNLQYDPHYFGGGTHNNLDGQDLDPHVDFTHHPFTGYRRRMNLIVYLNKEWDKSWGGNIELHKNPRLPPEEDEIISVEPLFNRAVIFETIIFHGMVFLALIYQRIKSTCHVSLLPCIITPKNLSQILSPIPPFMLNDICLIKLKKAGY